MAAFDFALSCVRHGTDDLLLPDRIDQAARDGNHHFRKTTLTPGVTLRLFAQQELDHAQDLGEGDYRWRGHRVGRIRVALSGRRDRPGIN